MRHSCALGTDVLVVGAGPVGLILTRLLGLRGHQVTIVEREADVYPCHAPWCSMTRSTGSLRVA